MLDTINHYKEQFGSLFFSTFSKVHPFQPHFWPFLALLDQIWALAAPYSAYFSQVRSYYHVPAKKVESKLKNIEFLMIFTPYVDLAILSHFPSSSDASSYSWGHFWPIRKVRWCCIWTEDYLKFRPAPRNQFLLFGPP